ncbi:VOC family protein [Streptomyces sp. NBC_01352]|uniref:VOC family protein n=1 Tax=Streptomyces sp. NBC_01352 TaxID=2903834 RepID=UPI002E371814|nr:VOC family protein [Streptomyces sp. NBC_01352]
MTERGPAPGRRGIPTARNVDHVAYTVADLAEAVAFFVDVLGGDLVYREGPIRRDDDWMAERLDVHPRAVAEIAMIRLGPTCNVELFQYTAPGRRTDPPRNHDVGGHHLAIAVEDIDAAVAYLAAQPGVRILGGPETIEHGPIAGNRWTYLRTPIGITLELLAIPDGSLPYERETAARRYAGEPGGWDSGH